MALPTRGTRPSSTHQWAGTSASHPEACTSLLDSLIHQGADSGSKKNYSHAACGRETTITEIQTKVRWQRNMSQMKEQDKTPEEQLSEVEIGNLHEKEFRVIIIKASQDLGKRMKAQIEKVQDMFNQDLEELKNKQRDEQYNN